MICDANPLIPALGCGRGPNFSGRRMKSNFNDSSSLFIPLII